MTREIPISDGNRTFHLHVKGTTPSFTGALTYLLKRLEEQTENLGSTYRLLGFTRILDSTPEKVRNDLGIESKLDSDYFSSGRYAYDSGERFVWSYRLEQAEATDLFNRLGLVIVDD